MKFFKWHKNKTGGKGETAYYIITAQRGYTSAHYHDFLKLFKHEWSYKVSYGWPKNGGPEEISWLPNITEQDYRSLIPDLFEEYGAIFLRRILKKL